MTRVSTATPFTIPTVPDPSPTTAFALLGLKCHVPPQPLHGLSPGFTEATEAAESGSFLRYLGWKSPCGLPTRPCFLSLGEDYFFKGNCQKKSILQSEV